jgi:hypothetical protein
VETRPTPLYPLQLEALRITRRDFVEVLMGGVTSWVIFPGGTKDMHVAIAVSCRAQNGLLNVEYTLANLGAVPLLAYDGAPGVPADAEWPDLDGQIYISVVQDTVQLKRINPPPIPGMNMNRVYIPPVSQVPPNGVRRVRFRLKLPLVERSQYTPDFSGAQYRDQVINIVQLSIGYFWKSDSTLLEPFPSSPNVFRVRGPHGEQHVASATSMQQLPVRVRTDGKFQRI